MIDLLDSIIAKSIHLLGYGIMIMDLRRRRQICALAYFRSAEHAPDLGRGSFTILGLA